MADIGEKRFFDTLDAAIEKWKHVVLDKVCEDILSAGRCGEFIQGYALLGTSLDTKNLNLLSQYNHVLLWLDPDAGGKAGIKSMVNRLRLFTACTIVQSDKDPKYYSRSELWQILGKNISLIR